MGDIKNMSIKDLLKRYNIDWNDLSLFNRMRLIWFGPPTILCWLVTPLLFLWGLITWDANIAGWGGMGLLGGSLGLWLSGRITFRDMTIMSLDSPYSKWGNIADIPAMVLSFVSGIINKKYAKKTEDLLRSQGFTFDKWMWIGIIFGILLAIVLTQCDPDTVLFTL